MGPRAAAPASDRVSSGTGVQAPPTPFLAPGSIAALWRQELEALERKQDKPTSQEASAAHIPPRAEEERPPTASAAAGATTEARQRVDAWLASTVASSTRTPTPAYRVPSQRATAAGSRATPVPDTGVAGRDVGTEGAAAVSVPDSEGGESSGGSSCSDDDFSGDEGEGETRRRESGDGASTGLRPQDEVPLADTTTDNCLAAAEALHRGAASCASRKDGGHVAAVLNVYAPHVATAVLGLQQHRTQAALSATLATAMTAYAASDPACARQLTARGALPALSACLCVHSSSSASPQAATVALEAVLALMQRRSRGTSRKLAHRLCESGCVEATLAVARNHCASDSAVAVAACTALATWCAASRRITSRASAAGALACVLAAMRAHRGSAPVVRAACQAFASLVAARCRGGAVAYDALNAGAPEEVVAAMRDFDSYGPVQLAGARALRLMCASSAKPSSAAARIAALGGLHACAVAAGLHAADTALCCACLTACRAILRAAGGAVVSQALSADVPAAAVYTWRLHGPSNHTCAAAAAGVLVALLEQGASTGHDGDEKQDSAIVAIDAVIASGAPQLAAQALQATGVTSRAGIALACLRLLAFCRARQGSPANAELALSAVLACMRRHSAHAGIAVTGAVCTRQLLTAQPPHQLPSGAALRCGAPDALVAVMACHASDAAACVALAAAMAAIVAPDRGCLQEQALLAAVLADADAVDVSVRLIRTGAIHALAACMHAHCIDSHVAESAAAACVAVLSPLVTAAGSDSNAAAAAVDDALSMALCAGVVSAAIACLRAPDAAPGVSALSIELLALAIQGEDSSPDAAAVDSLAGVLDAAALAVARHGATDARVCFSFAMLVDAVACSGPHSGAALAAAGCSEALVLCLDCHASSVAVAQMATKAYASLARATPSAGHSGPSAGAAKAGVRVCCDALRMHGSARVGVATHAATALAALCAHHAPSSAIAGAAGAPAALCSALRAHCSHADTVAAVARCLAVLARHEVCAQSCGSADVLEALVTALALQPHSIDVARAVGDALAAAAEFTSSNRDEVLGSQSAASVAPVSLNSGTNSFAGAKPGDPCLALSCACALLASHGSSDALVAVSACSAIAALMPVVGRTSSASSRARNVTPAAPTESAEELPGKAMPLLLLVLSAHANSPEARDAACRALQAVLRVPRSRESAPPQQSLAARALELGAVSLCLDALEDAPSDAGVQVAALQLLCELLDGGTDVQQEGAPSLDDTKRRQVMTSAVSDGAVELAVAALINHGGCDGALPGNGGGAPGGFGTLMLSLPQTAGHVATVVAAACGVIARLSAVPDCHTSLVDALGVTCLVQSLAAHGPASPLVAMPACCAVANLASLGQPQTVELVLASGAVNATIAVLEAHGASHAGVTAAACDTLRGLTAAGTAYNVALDVADAGGLEALSACLAVFGHVAAIQQAGLSAAACVCWSHPQLVHRARDAGLPLLARAALDTRWKGHPGVADAAQLVLSKVGTPEEFLSAHDAWSALGEATGADTVVRAVHWTVTSGPAPVVGEDAEDEPLSLPASADTALLEDGRPQTPEVLTWEDDQAIVGVSRS